MTEVIINIRIIKMKSVLALLALTAYLSASSDVCKIQWILSDGVQQNPPSSMKTITIVDFDRDDRERAALDKKIADLLRTPDQVMRDAAIQAGRDFAYDENLGGHRDKENALHEKAKKIHGSDGVKLKTTNSTMSYPFANYINSDDGKFGISYKSQDGTVLDRLQDGTILLKKDGDEILKAKCPKI
jgi:hypothetical protein